jgi:hypothetical protein
MLDRDSDKYNPYIKYKSSLNNISIAILKDKITDELIANNHFIKLLVYNDEYYKEYDITVTTLPIMNISFDDTDENKANIQEKDKDVYGAFYLFDNESNIETTTNLKFHVRGATSAGLPKKGYKLSLKDSDGNSFNQNLLNMRNDDDWLLYPWYNEEEMVRGPFSSRIWYDIFSSDNSFKVKAGNYYKYVELFMNGEYYGLYSFGFPIDSKQLELTSSDYLFKKGAGYKELDYFDLNDNNPIPSWIDKSNNQSDNNFYYLKKYFNDLNTATSLTDYYLLHDKTNLYDYYLFCLFVQNIDNWKQLFIALKGNIALYIPWDLDMTFGASWNDHYRNGLMAYALDSDDNTVEYPMDPLIFMREIDEESINREIKNRYDLVFGKTLTKEYINSIIDMYEKDIYYSGSYIRNKNRWPDSSQNLNNKNLDRFRSFVMNRYESLSNYINNL